MRFVRTTQEEFTDTEDWPFMPGVTPSTRTDRLPFKEEPRTHDIRLHDSVGIMLDPLPRLPILSNC